MSEEITVICMLCGYEGSAHEAGSHQCIVDTLTKIKDAKADTDGLAEALEALGLDYDGVAAGPERQGDGWHYFACPTRHGFRACDAKCIAARKALSSEPTGEN